MKEGLVIYQICRMAKEDIPYAVDLWFVLYSKYCNRNSVPDFWPGGKGVIESYLCHQIDLGNAFVAKSGGIIVGYLAWMYFDFHSERTAFCPIVGHAALSDDEEKIYLALYTESSQKWVQDNRFNHLWMTFFNDVRLRDALYEIGFGSYVIDACAKISPSILQTSCPYRITKATPADGGTLLRLAKETRAYYLSAPLFLLRKEYAIDDIDKIEHAFIAWDNDNVIGVISFSTEQSYHFEKLTSTESCYLGGIGAYVKPEYRSKGIGTCLLNEVFSYCQTIGKPYVHVSYETANVSAGAFWPKHFEPMIRSVRRTINKDANSML